MEEVTNIKYVAYVVIVLTILINLNSNHTLKLYNVGSTERE